MKKYYILFISFALMFSCTDYDVADTFNLKELPGYVAFNAPGEDAVMDDIEIDENEGSVELNIEAPTGTLTDVTITYDFAGSTAVYGVDFDVTGASTSGGSIVMEVDPNDTQSFDNVDLVINILTDGTQDGAKTILINLISASNAEGSLDVGRGGTDFLKTATIIVGDVDCGFATGAYNVAGTILVDDFGSGPYAYTDALSLADCAADGIYEISDITGGLYTNDYAIQYGVDPAVADIIIDQATGAVTWSGVSDQFGGAVIEDPAAASPSNYDAANGIITINWTATAFGERGITVYTLQ